MNFRQGHGRFEFGVFLDDLILPVLTLPMDLASVLNFDSGAAWVGFTASTGGEIENHDLLMWSFRPNTPPHVQMTAPVTGRFFLPTNLTLSAEAIDADGDITGVEFFANSNSVGLVGASPFSMTWSNAPAGTYSLTAIAFDDLGAATKSLPLTISLIELRLQHQVRQTNGNITFTFTTLAGRTYTVQYSADLVQWRDAVPSLDGTGGVVQWEDTGPPVTDGVPAAQRQRFYRIISP
jgi:hypothetical protein